MLPKAQNQSVTPLDQIYNDPDAQHALDLSDRFNTGSLDEAGLKGFLDSLPASATTERAKLEKLINGDNTRVDADLSTRSGQLVWAAGLGFLYQNSPPNTVRTHSIWNTLTRNAQVSESLGTAARYIDLSVTNRNATMDWGTPGSWFWFSPDNNHINIDLFNTLLAGFAQSPVPGIRSLAHATGIMMHEVGHSQLTTRFTDGMLELKKRETEFHKASKERKLTQAEYTELARTRKEFQLRMAVMNAAEDNCVNQFAVEKSHDFPHDFRKSLNTVNVVLQGTGAYLKDAQDTDVSVNPVLVADPNEREIVQAQQKLDELGKILALAFYTSNGLFDRDDIETWQKLGIDPEKFTTPGTTKVATAANQFLGKQSDFDHLIDLSVGRNGLSALQPAERDRWLLQNIFAKSVDTYADRRCQIIDAIWDDYAAPYAKVLIDAAEQQAQNQMDQKKQQQPGQSSRQQSQPGPSDSSGTDGPSDSQDNPSPSQGGSQQSSPEGQSDQQPSGNPSATDHQASTSPGHSAGGSPTQGGASQEATDEDAGSPSTVDVEGVGEMDIDGMPLPATPEDARKAERRAEDENAKPADAKTVRDLAREARQQERNANPANSAGHGQAPTGDLSIDAGDKGGRQKGLDLASLAKGNWTDFRKRINELEPIIAPISDDFNYIRDKQKHPVRTMARKKEELPRGGDIVSRLDMRSQMILATKRATGQQPELVDRQKWKVDEVQAESTTVELWVLGDGSGSMSSSLPGGGRRIDSAVQSMAILYEAGRRANFDTFVGMWGDNAIRLIAKPGDNDRTIGQNFETVRDGINSGTQLSPSLTQAIEQSAQQETNADGRVKKFAGMTHFLIISDGELNESDIDPTAKVIKQLFNYGPAVSVDIAILGGSGSEMQQVVNMVKKTNPAAAIDVLKANDPKDIPKQLAKRVKKRFEQSAEDMLAIPDAVKRDAFTNVHRAIKRL